jgi:hypothetical protein
MASLRQQILNHIFDNFVYDTRENSIIYSVRFATYCWDDKCKNIKWAGREVRMEYVRKFA